MQFDLHLESVGESIREGEPVQIQTAMIDVTEQCRAERERQNAAEALRESNGKLEEMLQELKQTQQQLIQQERLRAVGQLTSGVCHGLNNTLSPILGYSELLLNRRDLPPQAHEFVKLINVGAHDAAAVVSRLREFYRLKGPQDVREPVDLGKLLQQVADLTQTKWRDEAHKQGKEIEVQRELAETPPVLGDPSELRELFTNLVINGIDAIPWRGSIALRVSEAPEAVVAEVADTGIGMTDDVRIRCLEPFFTTKDLEGTGLGLSVCHGILERHDGRIEIDSNRNQGTTVRIFLPKAQQGDSGEPGRAQESLSRGRVLYIDDDARLRTLLSKMLGQLGQQVDTAEGGEAGISMVESNEYDLVITDLGMPGMDGSKVTRTIKSLRPDLPVVMLTGWGSETAALNLPPDVIPDYILTKPVTLSLLRAALSKMLRQ